MTTKGILLLTGIWLMSVCAMAQEKESYKHVNRMPAAKTTIADPLEADYDVQYLKFDIEQTDTSIYVKGNVTTTAKVIASAGMGTYVFELYSGINIDSAKINGQILPVSTSGNLRKIILPVALNTNSIFTAQVFYRGNPPTGSGFFNGITHAVSGSGTHMVFTISDPYVASSWWPCKQSIDDKIDSVEMNIKVPAGLKAGSNGLMVGIDSATTAGWWKYTWRTKYPIDYYLISIAVAKYEEYKSYMHFNATDSMLVQNFFIDTATFNPLYKTNFDSIGTFINYFSGLFGRYPFWKEKYGVCYTTLPGGMEHQTMTTIGVPNTYIIAHELCHQWFGDHVTYATWGHVWLSEGFATYGEQLFLNQYWGGAAAKSHRQGQYNNAMSSAGGSVFVTDTTSANTLFDQRYVYNKAAAVVHMLRGLAPADSVFFNVLKTFQQQYGYGLATTENLRDIAAAAYNKNLDTFFNQWIYRQGYPKYAISWNQVGNQVIVKLVQTPSFPTSVPLFYTPVELQLHSATADTVVSVYNNALTQIFTFNWSSTMTTLYLEPNIRTLCKLNGLVTHDVTLGVNNLTKQELQVFPNPTHNEWVVSHILPSSTLTLYDLQGRTVWTAVAESAEVKIPAAGIASGNYMLQISSNDKTKQSLKLTKW
jgi:aminopeptidase N